MRAARLLVGIAVGLVELAVEMVANDAVLTAGDVQWSEDTWRVRC